MNSSKKIQDDIISYREMCNIENQEVMQRGMNFRMNTNYSVVLMSQRSNAPYSDRVYDDGITIEYEGHDELKFGNYNVKKVDQPEKLPSGKLTQNGYFIKAVNEYRTKKSSSELVKIYEKVLPGTWSLKGYFDLVDYKKISDGKRNVFRFILKLSNRENNNINNLKIDHTRIIPSDVKRDVWKRDGGKCVICRDNKNLHFDHDLPFSRGGTSLSSKNVRILCMKCNLRKSDKIE
jgi:hypothetical protein